MKRTLLFILSFLSGICAFSQDTSSTMLPVVLDAKTYAYVNGRRLDSVNSEFAEFNLKGIDGISFNYGQKFQIRKELLLTNDKGIPLVFENRSTPFLLNFFYFNGWQLTNMYNPHPDEVVFILKKIN